MYEVNLNAYLILGGKALIMRVITSYAHAYRRTRHTMIMTKRGRAELCKRAIGKDRPKSHRNYFIDNQFFKFKLKKETISK